MDPEELRKVINELEPLRAARVALEAVRWTHGRTDGPVGLVTGPGSRARADFSSGLKKTARYVRVEHFLARLDDPSAVASAIRRAKDAPDVLVIAVCRGGGDERDLSVFSHPDVVRAVAEAASIKPVVTGIGHTEDHCLADDYATIAAALPYAAGDVIHQSRQAAWRRLQEERASVRHAPALFRRPTARHRGISVKWVVAGVLGALLAVASCPTDRRGPATTTRSPTPAKQDSASRRQEPTRRQRSEPSPQKSPVAPPRPPGEQPALPPPQAAQDPASAGEPPGSAPAGTRSGSGWTEGDP